MLRKHVLWSIFSIFLFYIYGDKKWIWKKWQGYTQLLESMLKCIKLLLVILERRTRPSAAIILWRKIKTVGKISLEKFDLFYLSHEKHNNKSEDLYALFLPVPNLIHVLSCFSHVWPFAILWTVVCQTPLSMGFSRQEYWSGLQLTLLSYFSVSSCWNASFMRTDIFFCFLY